MDTHQQHSYSGIFRFWLPLAATWLMMSVEGPFIAAIIARLGAEKDNLAAYGVAYAFALVAESPIIMLMSASTALCRSRHSYIKLRNFSLILSLSVTLLMALFLLSPLYGLIIDHLLGMPTAVSQRIHLALLCLLPWPGAIGIRRFYQGVLITSHQTRLIAFATCFRLASMASCALLCYFFSPLAGATIGALSLSSGVTAEMLLTRLLARQAVQKFLHGAAEHPDDMQTYRQIWNYYLPLALTPFIGLSVHPMVTFFLGKSRSAVDSLAVMPVIYGLTFIFRAMGLSYQEVAIALLGKEPDNYLRIRNFAIWLALGTSSCLFLIAFTPLNTLWFEQVSGLSASLSDFAALPLQITAIFPALTVFLCFQRSVLIAGKQTRPVSLATTVEAIAIFALLFISVQFFDLAGAVAATSAYVLGRLAAIAGLQKIFLRQARRFYKQTETMQ